VRDDHAGDVLLRRARDFGFGLGFFFVEIEWILAGIAASLRISLFLSDPSAAAYPSAVSLARGGAQGGALGRSSRSCRAISGSSS
jgi:hypothetical protein